MSKIVPGGAFGSGWRECQDNPLEMSTTRISDCRQWPERLCLAWDVIHWYKSPAMEQMQFFCITYRLDVGAILDDGWVYLNAIAGSKSMPMGIVSPPRSG